MSSPVPDVWNIYGTVYNVDGTPFNRGKIQAFDSYHGVEYYLGENGIGHDGNYTITYSKSQFQRGDVNRTSPNLVIKILDYDERVIWSSSVITDVTQPFHYNVTLDSGGEDDDDDDDDDEPSSWSISGVVHNADNTPHSTGVVKIFDLVGTTEYLLGSVETDATGVYSLSYTSDDFQHGETTRPYPNLIVRVYNESDHLLAQGNVQYPPSANEIFNVTLPQPPEMYKVTGTVTNTLDYPVSSIEVKLVNLALRDGEFQETLIGTAETSNRGEYAIEYDPLSVLGINSPEQLSIFAKIERTEDGDPEDGDPEDGDPEDGDPEDGDPEDGDPEDGDPEDGDPEDGDPEDGVPEDGVPEDGVPEDGVPEVLTKSSLYRNPRKNLTIDLRVDLPSNTDLSEYNDLSEAFEEAGLTDELVIKAFWKTEILQYIAEVTNQPKNKILNRSRALILFNDLKNALKDTAPDLPDLIDSRVIYALIKAGTINTFYELRNLSPSRLHSILVSAIVQDILPSDLEENLSEISQEWETIYKELLGIDEETDTSRLLHLAELGTLDEKVREIYARYSHSIDEFWEHIEKEIEEEDEEEGAIKLATTTEDGPSPKEEIKRLQFYFDIYFFADEFEPLSTSMIEYAKSQNSECTDFQFESLEDFVTLEKDDWDEIIDGIENFDDVESGDEDEDDSEDEPVDDDEVKSESTTVSEDGEYEVKRWPENVPGESDLEKRKNYAHILYKRIIATFAMQRFRYELNALELEENDHWAGWQEVKSFLNEEGREDFDFAETIDPDTLLEDGEFSKERANLYNKLLTVQRIYRLTPRFKAINGLLKKKLTSAMAIAHRNGDEFVRDFAEIADGIDDAHTIHDAAVHTASQALFLMGTFNQQSDFKGQSLPPITETNAPEKLSTGIATTTFGAMSTATKEVSKQSEEVQPQERPRAIPPAIPDIVTLFGNQNQCKCEECQSVFSPSAYTVDLLEFLNRETRTTLFERRPDLAQTDLSCRNTNGPVAYIDLVNEALQNAACIRSFFFRDNGDKDFENYLDSDFSKIEEIDLPPFVRQSFAAKGFFIDDSFYRQPLKPEEEPEENDDSKIIAEDANDENDDIICHLIGDGWRYVIKMVEETEADGQGNLYYIEPYPQTGKDAQKRRVIPEHNVNGAYEVMDIPVYPAKLPFSLPFVEINEFLQLRECKRYQLYHVLNKSTNILDKSCKEEKCSFFEMTDSMWDLVASEPSEHNRCRPCELWGYGLEHEGEGRWISDLSNVGVFMRRSGLSFDGVLDILSTAIVNWDGALYIEGENEGEEDDSYERGAVDEMRIGGTDSDRFTVMARFLRLCTYLNLDFFTVDQLLSYDIDPDKRLNIDDLYIYLRVAEDFSVSPLQAATWYSSRVNVVNLNRGVSSQLEDLFISKIHSPERASVWREMLNDTTYKPRGKFQTDSRNKLGGDVQTLLAAMRISYEDLTLICVHEFPDVTIVKDAVAILRQTDLSAPNLGTLFRVADFSKTLGISITDFYRLKPLFNNYFDTDFLYGMRDVVKKLRKFKINLKEFEYLLTGKNSEDIRWVPSEKDELKTILQAHHEVKLLKQDEEYENNSEDLIEKAIINVISSEVGIADDLTQILMEQVLNCTEYSEKLLGRWVENSKGGWSRRYSTERSLKSGKIISEPNYIPSVQIIAGSEIEVQKLPVDTRNALWETNLFVEKSGNYELTVNSWVDEEYELPDIGEIIVTVTEKDEDGEIIELDPDDLNLEKGKVYPVTINWIAPEGDGLEDISQIINISCLWRDLESDDYVVDLLGAENTVRYTELDLNKIANSAYLIKKMNIASGEIKFLLQELIDNKLVNIRVLMNLLGVEFDGPVLQANFRRFLRLVDIYILNTELPFAREIIDFFEILKFTYSNLIAKKRQVGRMLNWSIDDIEEIMTHFDLDDDDLQSVSTFVLLNNAITLLDKTGVSANLGYNIFYDYPEIDGDGAEPPPPPEPKSNNSLHESQALMSAVQSHFTPQEWADYGEPIRDKIRLRLRDALCAYLFTERYIGNLDDEEGPNPDPTISQLEILSTLLLHKLGDEFERGEEGTPLLETVKANLPKLKDYYGLNEDCVLNEDIWVFLDCREEFYNIAAIYSRFLIDVSMDSVVKTTRIVQANSTIQMFVQRAVLNFEPDVLIDDKTKLQWKWMKNYRLWEANRKIFLYPENWLDPEFRDDKTPLFQELETELMKKDLNKHSTEEAFKAYASGLSDVSNLEIIGSYHEGNESQSVLHVVGRTYHSPHSYYYRRNVENKTGLSHWSPWDKVDLDINSDLVIPVPFRNKIYLFWPIIELKEKVIERDVSEEEGNKKSDDDEKYEETIRYFELKLAWSEYSNGKWSAKRISQNTLIHALENIDHEQIEPTDLFHFKAEVTAEKVDVVVYAFSRVIEEIVVKKKVLRRRLRRLFRRRRKRYYYEEVEEVFTKEHESINSIARFEFGYDNSATLHSIDESPDVMEAPTIPSNTSMRHNRAEECDENNETEIDSLEYPKNNPLFKQTPETYVCFPSNLSFLDGSYRPFFFQQNGKTFYLNPVSCDKRVVAENDPTVHHEIKNFYHPLADELERKANLSSIDDLLNRATQANAKEAYPMGYQIAGDEHARHLANLSFAYQYLPSNAIIGNYPAPVNDFCLESPYGIYNWEMFFHLPLYIATRLSKDHQFEEAMRWFHFIFNPGSEFTTYEKTQRWAWSLPPGARYWNFLPLFANRGVQDSIYKAVAKSGNKDDDTPLGSLIDIWKNDPFKPHLIARIRVAAYQKAVVMKYLDNLINWGDSLFRLDHMEAINEATNIYVQATEVLGEKPRILPKLHEMPGMTYQQLKDKGLDEFSNTTIQLENYIPPPPPLKVRFWRARRNPSRYYYYHYNYGYDPTVENVPYRSIQLLRMAPTMHYFCIPTNPNLLSYWNVVEDRLFKIRHSMNIDGVKRVIPLFAPPIDPGMVARAVGSGLDIGTILRDMQTSPSVYRYSIVYQKAVELCNELKSFGSELLSAIEKKDAEQLAVLRQNHESEMLKLATDIRKCALDEAVEAKEVLKKQRSITEERYEYYKEIDKYTDQEKSQLNYMSNAAVTHLVGQMLTMASGPASLIPDGFGGALLGMTGGALAFGLFGGGSKTSESLEKAGNALTQTAGIFDRAASILGTTASYERRWNDWKLQEEVAKKEIKHIDNQILASEIRIQIAQLELDNHKQQVKQALEVKELMESKFSNEQLYQWMSDELTKTYNTLYDLAYSAAKKAERAYQFELGIKGSSYITPEVWESSKKGLLAGNRLMLQLRQLDNSYSERNRREHEITKSVSLRMLEPLSLLRLKENGTCDFSLPEEIFDFDYQGHFFRRIKSVRVTIPCVSGPYTSINAKLQLVNSKVRVSSELTKGRYAESDDEQDKRFLVNPITPMSIATSNAQMDSGTFELNFNDERYLPFEGAGAISEWRLELPEEFRQFDYNTISDVIVTVDYTAREASSPQFITTVTNYLKNCLEDNMYDVPHLISLKNSFPAQLEGILTGNAETVTLKENHIYHIIADYIKRANENDLEIGGISVILKLKETVSGDFTLKVDGTEFGASDDIGNLVKVFNLSDFSREYDSPLGDWEFELDTPEDAEVEDIFLIFNYPSKSESSTSSVNSIEKMVTR
ncbi:neuraminidase-like domain-containing protein [Chitinispirillales bacterium ANBcel5]|uniref:Tc toxin subunit A-related protein n=1 Tax=Cellulosispirillum alkaliphilum TaxID=3039283 RepID=UPI002A56671C|nr:neuraminidase-like domain-containing protein [Chitinispirillales bacterium ANBcel5]